MANGNLLYDTEIVSSIILGFGLLYIIAKYFFKDEKKIKYYCKIKTIWSL